MGSPLLCFMCPEGGQSPRAAVVQALVDELLPVFSQTKVNDCFGDIMVPSWTNYDVVDDPVTQPWEARLGTPIYANSCCRGRHFRMIMHCPGE